MKTTLSTTRNESHKDFGKKIPFHKFITLLVVVITLAVSCSKDDETPAPELTISSISPDTGGEGTEVNITGTGFSTILAENTVTLNTKTCPVLVSTATLLKITIPADAGSGNIKVTVGSKTVESATFTFIPPAPALEITSIAPTSGPKGTSVVIAGTGFSATAANNTVTINGKACNVTNASTTGVTIVIPAGAGSGVIHVSVDGDAVDSQEFTFTFTTEVHTLAGSTSGFAEGTGLTAKFAQPYTVAVDANGNVYVADTDNHKIRKITPAGEVTIFAGSTQGDAEGTGAAAQFNYPYGVATDASGNVYVADTHNHKVKKITPAGVVTTLAGSTGGYADGTGSAAQFYYLTGVTAGVDGNVYVADKDNHKIRKVTSAGVVTTLAGSTSGFANGTGSAAQFSQPYNVATDAAGNVYVVDTGNHRIRKITSGGEVTTFAGSTQGDTEGAGPAAQFSYPYGIAADASGNLYVVDTFNQKVKKITSAGAVTTLAGSTNGFADGAPAAAQFNYPTGVAVSTSGTVYVADKDNHKIRKITID